MNRRRDIDWMRGVAVLCMIEHHTFDAFLRAELHGSPWDRLFRFVGGVAAPGFLFLAGLALALMLEKQAARGTPARDAALAGARRGLWILAGAYLFRFQEWALAFGASPASDLLRIDVLNCIGLALAAVALAWWAAPRAPAFLAVALAVALGTPLLWHAPLAHLPQLLSDYLRGQPPRALFPLFPWVAHAFAGAALGVVLARIPREREGLLLLGLTACAALAWLTLHPSPWRDDSPAVFLLRDTLVLPLLSLCWLADRLLPQTAHDPLLKLGRHSLAVYWVHVEIVYGRWLWRARGTLGLAQGALAVGAVVLAMIALAYLIEPARALFRRRPAAFRVAAW